METVTQRTVEVVVWSPHGDAVARPPALQQVAIAMDDALALPTLVNTIRDRASLEVAVVAVADEQVHVELLEPARGIAWAEPDVAIPGHAPWYELGWYPAACSTIADALRRRDIAVVGRIEQRKHWSISAILRLPTTAGDLWFKQVPAFMAHEGPVTEWLGSLVPGAVPEIVEVGRDWSITRAFPAPSDDPGLESPFGVLAELQQRAAERLDELFALGCPDRRSASLLRDLQSLAERHDVVEDAQRRAVLGAIPALRDRCERLDTASVPASIVHGDLHAGNWTRADDGRWIIFDWTDACVAHPFVDLGVLPSRDERVREARLRCYLDAWQLRAGVDHLLADAFAIGAAHQAISYQRIVDGVRGDDGPSWHPAVRHFLDQMLDRLAA